MQCSKLSCQTKTASFLIKKKKAELTEPHCCSPNSFLSVWVNFFPPVIAQHVLRANPSTSTSWAAVGWGSPAAEARFPFSTGCFFPNTRPALISPGAAQSLPLSSKSCARQEQQQQRAELGSGCFVLSRTKCVEMGFSFRLPSRSHSFCFWRGAL